MAKKTKHFEQKLVTNTDDTQPSWQCRSCGHDHYEEVSDLPTTYHAGFTDEGKKYTHVSRKRVRCLNCNQITVLMTHDFDAKSWVE